MNTAKYGERKKLTTSKYGIKYMCDTIVITVAVKRGMYTKQKNEYDEMAGHMQIVDYEKDDKQRRTAKSVTEIKRGQTPLTNYYQTLYRDRIHHYKFPR